MDADRIKQFCIYNCEKMIVVIIVAVSGFLIFQGTKAENYTASKDPETLKSSASQTRLSVDDDHTDNIIIAGERVPTLDIVATTQEILTPVPQPPYALSRPWRADVNVDSSIRREAIVVAPPTDVIARAVLRTIAIRSPSQTYALQDAEPAEAPEKIEAPAPRRSRRAPRRSPMGMDGGMDQGMGGMEMEMEMEMGMEMEMEMEMGMGMGMDGSMAGGGSGRRLDPKFDAGIRPVAEKQFQSETVTQEPIPSGAWFIACTAVMPHKELHEAYKNAFDSASGFRYDRDRPNYLDYEIQRADVTEKTLDQLTDADWVKRGDFVRDTYRAAAFWCGVAPDYVPNDYRHVRISGYIPPVLVDEYASFTTHPKIPLLTVAERKMIDRAEAPVDAPIIDIESLEATAVGAVGGGGMGMEMGMEMGMGMDEGMGYGMGGMGGGMGVGGMIIEPDPVDYKILRFYDFYDGRQGSPMPKRQYVYRVRVAVENPNFPEDPRKQPRSSTLAPAVYEQVSSLKNEAARTKKRDFKQWSDWSTPCDPVSLPGRNEFYAGKVKLEASREGSVQGRPVKYSAKPPKAKMVLSTFSFEYSTRMPYWIDVTEGDVLAATGDVDVVDPITLEIKKLPEQTAAAGATVIDISGGDSLALTEGDDMTAPGVILMFDEDGGLIVGDEVGDQQQYRKYSFADERGL